VKGPKPKPAAERFAKYVDKSSGCWLWTAAKCGGQGVGGYGLFYVNRSRRKVYAHRFAWELAYGAVPNELHVCHHCDTPLCVRPDHLFLGTSIDNSNDMVSKGRSAIGTRNAQSKLNEDDVRYIRASGENQYKLATMFGVCQPTVSDIIRRKLWSALP
jgi:predicted XRE-type DNA-binding protein